MILAAENLASLLEQIVFVGGCVTGLLITDPAAAPVRSTLDVDAIAEITSYPEYVAIEMRLGELGFCPSEAPRSPVCRWVNENLILDLRPTDSSVLGFSNEWYGGAFKNARNVSVGGHKVRIITAPYFVATKLEALHGRGENDFRLSHDLEDIITVIDGRVELIGEISESSMELRRYLGSELRSLLANSEFRDALPGHLLPDEASQKRISLVVQRIQQIIDLA